MIANFVTSLRIVFSLIMLYFPVFSPGFYACYLLAGITDMVDGSVARRFGTESEFGEKLDTVADTIFVAVHSLANKITGIALFLLPLTLPVCGY